MTDKEAYDVIYGIVQNHVILHLFSQEEPHEALEILKEALEFKKEVMSTVKKYGGEK